MAKTFKGRVVVPGTVTAKALVSHGGFNTLASYQSALMFGDKDVKCGDQNNPDIYKKPMIGVALCLPQTIGSTTGGMVFYTAGALGKLPACMCFSKPIRRRHPLRRVDGDAYARCRFSRRRVPRICQDRHERHARRGWDGDGRMKCAIYGAGSLGTVLGAYMTKGGVPVELVNRNRAHVDALREKGAHITGTVDFSTPVTAITPEEITAPYDVIFLMTKQLHNKEVVTFLKPLLAPDGVIVTFQNGIPEPGIAEIVGESHTIGCVVEWGATMDAPGECVLTSDPDSLSFHMGGMQGVSDAKLAEVRSLLEKMCPVAMEDNLLGARWSKLLINATFSGLGTVVGGVFGDVSEKKDARRVAVRCMKECIDVGHAAGATFAPVQGKDLTKLFYYKNGFKRAIAELLVPIAMKKHRAIEPSMLQDLKKGKPCEIDAINGVVCEWGRKCGVPTPINDRIVEIVKKEQTGELPLEEKNIRFFDDLL